jgi:PadR family transcriptional regulator, regulatory protein AphA
MSLPYAILGLLNYMPMTGYDLKKFFNNSINFFWSAQMSQIYRDLKNLEEKGYVSSKAAPSEKGPNKIIYTITKQGISYLKEWLTDTPENIDEDNRNAFLLRVMLLSNVGAGELHFQIQKRLKKYRKDLKALETVKENLRNDLKHIGKESLLLYWEITLNRGFHDVKSHIAWAEETLSQLKKIMAAK